MQNKIFFSKMQKEDLDKVVEIEAANFSLPWTKTGFLEAIEKPYCIFIVAKTSEKEIIAYCGMYQSDTQADITNVSVDKGFQGKGIGKMMLKELIEIGRAAGIKDFTLEVRCSNTKALNLYSGLGFKSLGIRKNFYHAPVEDANIMWLYG